MHKLVVKLTPVCLKCLNEGSLGATTYLTFSTTMVCEYGVPCFIYYYALCRYAECRYTECQHAVCRYAECGHLFSDDAQGRSDHAAVHEVRFSCSHLALKLKPGTKKNCDSRKRSVAARPQNWLSGSVTRKRIKFLPNFWTK